MLLHAQITGRGSQQPSSNRASITEDDAGSVRSYRSRASGYSQRHRSSAGQRPMFVLTGFVATESLTTHPQPLIRRHSNEGRARRGSAGRGLLTTDRLGSQAAVVMNNDEAPPFWPPVVDGNWRQAVFFALSEPSSCVFAHYFAVFVMLVIILSSVSFVIQSYPRFRIQEEEEGKTILSFFLIELACIAVFTLEYLLRVLTVTSVKDPTHKAPVHLEDTPRGLDLAAMRARPHQVMPVGSGDIVTGNITTGSLPSKPLRPPPDDAAHDAGAGVMHQLHSDPVVTAVSGIALARSAEHATDVGPLAGAALSADTPRRDPFSGTTRRPPRSPRTLEETRRQTVSKLGVLSRSDEGVRPRTTAPMLLPAPPAKHPELKSVPPEKQVGDGYPAPKDIGRKRSASLPMRVPERQVSFARSTSTRRSRVHNGMERTNASKVWQFMRQPLNIIDLLAILPFYVELVVGGSSNLTVLRILRLARVFRIFRLGRYSTNLMMMGRVIKNSFEALTLLLFFVGLGVIVFGSLIFFAEAGDYDPDLGVYVRPNPDGPGVIPTPFKSIPESFYWVLVTTTTVGYGDMVPQTTLGKFVAVIVMHAGVLVLALPITVLGANFAAEWNGAGQAVDAEEDDMPDDVRQVFGLDDLFDADLDKGVDTGAPATVRGESVLPPLTQAPSFDRPWESTAPVGTTASNSRRGTRFTAPPRAGERSNVSSPLASEAASVADSHVGRAPGARQDQMLQSLQSDLRRVANAVSVLIRRTEQLAAMQAEATAGRRLRRGQSMGGASVHATVAEEADEPPDVPLSPLGTTRRVVASSMGTPPLSSNSAIDTE